MRLGPTTHWRMPNIRSLYNLQRLTAVEQVNRCRPIDAVRSKCVPIEQVHFVCSPSPMPISFKLDYYWHVELPIVQPAEINRFLSATRVCGWSGTQIDDIFKLRHSTSSYTHTHHFWTMSFAQNGTTPMAVCRYSVCCVRLPVWLAFGNSCRSGLARILYRLIVGN